MSYCQDCELDFVPDITGRCPQCRALPGYLLVSDASERTRLWHIASVLMNDHFTRERLDAEPSARAILDRGWVVVGVEGGLHDDVSAGTAKFCEEVGIKKVIGLLIEKIYEPANSKRWAAATDEKDAYEIPYVSLVDATFEAMENFLCTFPLSMILVPESLDFLLYQHTNEAALIAGPRTTVESIMGSSVEKVNAEFEHWMTSAGTIKLYDHFLSTIIQPVMSKS